MREGSMMRWPFVSRAKYEEAQFNVKLARDGEEFWSAAYFEAMGRHMAFLAKLAAKTNPPITPTVLLPADPTRPVS
jgi:hypothetical protein